MSVYSQWRASIGRGHLQRRPLSMIVAQMEDVHDKEQLANLYDEAFEACSDEDLFTLRQKDDRVITSEQCDAIMEAISEYWRRAKTIYFQRAK